jgi:hypothetical protein
MISERETEQPGTGVEESLDEHDGLRGCGPAYVAAAKWTPSIRLRAELGSEPREP